MTKISKKIANLSISQIRTIGLFMAAITVIATGSVFTLREKQSHAQSDYDSSVQVRVVGYGGSITVRSTNHAFGNCNNGPNQDFVAPVTCNGYQFGPPDWVYIYLPAAPAGTTFAGWSLLSDNTDNHSIGCSTTSCSFNFNSGSAVVQARFTPGAFSASGQATSTSSITLNWSAAGNAQTYQVVRNGTIIANLGPSTSYANGGLACGTTYSYQIYAGNGGGTTAASNNPISVATQSCPPPPTPTPTPTGGGGSGSPKPTSPTNPVQHTNPSPIQGSSNTSSSDTTPPTVPANFRAVAEDGKTYVDVSWDESTDDNGIKSYELDRSTDQQKWTNMKSDFTDTTYQDESTTFATHYFYRLRAQDNKGNSSTYTTTDITTPKFDGNANSGEDVTIHDDANNISITIPAGALSDNAQCNILADDSVLAPNIDNYRTIGGPNQLLCKKSDGTVISQFSKSLKVEWKLIPPKDVSGVKYYGYTNNWQVLATKSHNSKTHTDSFQLTNGTTFAAMGKLKHTPVYVKILEALFVLGAIGLGIAAFFYRRNRSKQQATLDDYWRKMHGG